MCCARARTYVHTRTSACSVRARTHMRWLRLEGPLELKVSFAKEPYKRDSILQKKTVILRSLLIVATPYIPASTLKTDAITDLYSCTRTHLQPIWSVTS